MSDKSIADTLGDDAQARARRQLDAPRPRPRLLRADRRQLLLQPTYLEDLISEDHRARLVWTFVESLDLGAFLDGVESVEGRAGRPAIDPAVLITMWLYATSVGVGSAREIERLIREHDAYRWIAGGLEISHRTLSGFRVDDAKRLDDLLVQCVTVFLLEGLMDLEDVAQDGMRVRASAGAASFRRAETLAECELRAREIVEQLKQELEHDDGTLSERQKGARKRAARERLERVQQAAREIEDVKKAKKKSDRHKARASTTDPQARVMHMPDGGFRPAYNAQFATDVASQVVVGVDVTQSGSDMAQMVPMAERVREVTGRLPTNWLVDGGYPAHKAINEMERIGCTVFAPPPVPKDSSRDRYAAREDDSKAVATWRQRMGEETAKARYKLRVQCECVNARARQCDLKELTVRGIDKVRSVLIWFALAHNMLRLQKLREAAC